MQKPPLCAPEIRGMCSTVWFLGLPQAAIQHSRGESVAFQRIRNWVEEANILNCNCLHFVGIISLIRSRLGAAGSIHMTEWHLAILPVNLIAFGDHSYTITPLLHLGLGKLSVTGPALISIDKIIHY